MRNLARMCDYAAHFLVATAAVASCNDLQRGDPLDSPRVDRRTFLKRGIAGGAVLLLGGGALAVLPTKEVGAAKRALAVLEPRSFQVVVAIARRVCPETADAVDVAHGVDDLLRRAPPETQSDFNKLLGLFENALPGFLFDQRFLPFTRLSPDAQDAVLRDWRNSRLVIRRT